MTTKDYSLLRAFDLEAAKRGEAIVTCKGSDLYEYVAGPDAAGNLCLRVKGSGLFTQPSASPTSFFRMAPLAWVEGKPVYKGDVLYNEVSGDKRTISGASETRLFADELHQNVGVLVSNLTWTPPKVKREGWVNIYPDEVGFCIASTSHVFPSKDKADSCQRGNRIACVRIEWEEVAQ